MYKQDKIHQLHAELISTITDKEGKIISEHKQQCQSFVRALTFFLCAQAKQGVAVVTTKDEGDVDRVIPAHVDNLRINAGAGIVTHGIIVGTSPQAVSVNDNKLIAKILHGIAAGQLSYGAMTIDDPVVDGSTVRFDARRTMTNSSGGTITVEEVGYLCLAGALNWSVLVDRSLKTANKNVLNGQALTETYRISVTV